jgi:hypothetical protein
MKPFSEIRANGTKLKNLYRQGYDKGRIEQLRQDVSMIEDVINRSQNYQEFIENLSADLRKIKFNIESGF